MKTPTLIAEIGCNHMGEIDTAHKFIDVLSDFCGVTHLKFQKRCNRELLSEAQYNSPHPVAENSYGATYGEHREYLEFPVSVHKDLKKYCEDRDIVYSSSVWDISSLKEIIELKPKLIKIPSATNTHKELLSIACQEYEGEIHISLGMTTRAEESDIVEIFQQNGRLKDVVLYACTSGYPIKSEEACLLEISRITALYGDSVGGIGYSGHHNGIALDVAAYTLGASYIERHFTLDRTWKGTDHAASLEPDGMRRLQRNLSEVQKALQEKPKEILDIEEPQRKKLKWSSPE
jgi:sialic acid synthase